MDTETYKEVVSVPAIAEHSMSIIRGYLSKSHDSVVRKMNETILERLTKHKNNIDMEQKEDSIQPVSISSLRKGILCGSTNSSLNKLPDMQMTTELLTSLQTPTPETNKKKKVEAVCCNIVYLYISIYIYVFFPYRKVHQVEAGIICYRRNSRIKLRQILKCYIIVIRLIENDTTL